MKGGVEQSYSYIQLSNFNTLSREFISLPAIISFNNNWESGQSSLIIDSGTTWHVFKDKNKFKHISDKRVVIKGINGRSNGFTGTLKSNKLGNNISAVWYDDLPVDALISPEGLKIHGWNTIFSLNGDYLENQ